MSKKPVAEPKSAVKRAAAREKKAGTDLDAAAKKTVSPAQQALQKMGLTRDIDLALHLPLIPEYTGHKCPVLWFVAGYGHRCL